MKTFWMKAWVGGLLAVAPIFAAEIAPIGAGAWAVGSSNFEVNATPPKPMEDYLKGKGTGGESTFVTDILEHPTDALVTTAAVPAGKAAFGRLAETKLPLAIYVLYPTTRENPRADYKFPYTNTGDNVFPHMQRAGEKPLLPEPGKRWPLIVYSHGYESHGLWDLEHMKALAAHGFIVAYIFHGDGRGSLESGVNLRPLEFETALDFLLGHPDYGPLIDPARIGVSGASFGGLTVLAAMGGKFSSGPAPVAKVRVKAGFGLVPFMGASIGFWPFTMDVWPFGQDCAGLRAVRLPFLAVYAQDDKNVRPENVEKGVAQLGGTASAVMLDGEKHLVSKATWSDITTWEVLFFETWLKGDNDARKKLYGATSVAGGVNDHRTFLHVGP